MGSTDIGVSVSASPYDAFMTRVLIQPSFGTKAAQTNWKKTLDKEVAFTKGRFRRELTDAEFLSLLELHPGGEAHFWGTTDVHDAKMNELQVGDVVLLTGDNHILAVGEIGVSFRNPQASKAIWEPDNKTKKLFQNIYSLISFQQTRIPYDVLRRLTSDDGALTGDVYRQARLLVGERADRVIDGLLIQTVTELQDLQRDAVEDPWLPGTVVEDEAHDAVEARQTLPRPGFVAVRNESALVVRYRRFLTETGDRRLQKRLRSVVGISDLYLLPAEPGHLTELIEAKSSAAHKYVREALAQLLDYAAHADREVHTLTALFPEQPSVRDADWLAMYGIRSVFEDSGGGFQEIGVRPDLLAHSKSLWQPDRAINFDAGGVFRNGAVSAGDESLAV